MRANRNPNSRHVPGRLGLPHDIAPRNASRPIERRHSRSSDSTLPLPGHVVGLVRAQSRPVADVGARGEVRPYVPHHDLVDEPEHAESHNQTHAVEDDDGAPEPEPVPHERGEEHGDDGVVVRRRGQQDGLVLAEAHPALQDDGQKVGHGGGHQVEQEEQTGESVDLEVLQVR